jgi:DNA-binding response OmpR family regulator
MGPSHRRIRFFIYRVLRALGLVRPIALVVEEHDDVAFFLGQILRQRAGFDVYYAFDGISGIQKAFALEPDLIVLDGVMPELNGLQALRVLRSTRTGRRAKIVLSTAYDQWKDLALAAGADAFFAKPFEVRELVDTCCRLVGQA